MALTNYFSSQIIFFGLIATLFISLAFLIWLIFLQINISRIKRIHNELFSGKKMANLEDLLLAQTKNLKSLDKDIQELYEISNQINSLALKSIHKTAMIRFNPFKEVGGNQSFAIALLNGKNSGIVISSLYTREGTRIYSKNIQNGQPLKHPLTEEEQKVVAIAANDTSKKI